MIDSGKAFSGNERNCVFLNTRDGRFADISAGSGLDFPDDGRAIAVTDWDQDGDLDLWISNRNAPRLRLLRNDGSGKNHFLALRLRGEAPAVNRDAIGSRVEVVLKNKSAPRLVQTLRGGQGFLAQSSKWVHLGLGDEEHIESIQVRWPDGRRESFPGVPVDGRYLLVQGTGRAETVPAAVRTIALTPSAPPLAPASSAARIPVVTLLRAPKLNIRDSKGEPLTKQSLLVNFWATWCAPCREELAQLRDRASDLRAAGLQVLALSVDDLDPATAGDPTKVMAALKFPFPSSKASERVLAAFQEFHDNLVGLNRPLPVPTSFLIDPDGHIAVIYKGPLEVDQLIADLPHSRGSLDQRVQGSAQIPGSMITHPVVAMSRLTHEASTQFRYGLARRADNDPEGAAYYLAAARRLDPSYAPAAKELTSLHLAQSRWKDARAELQAYLHLEPGDAVAHHEMALLQARLGQPEKARRHFENALRLNPDDGLTHFDFASFLVPSNPAGAVSHFRTGLRLQPDNRFAANNLAWLLATHPDERIRKPAEALEMVTRINQETGGQIPNILDTLAAAQAATGDFKAAAATAGRALALPGTAQNPQLAAALKERLTLYQKGKPFRVAAPPQGPTP
jgi:peroxiredoxin/Flp pilus assembly protein TadD